MSYATNNNAMGAALTSWACDEVANADAWRQRVNKSISAGAAAALIGGVGAGLLGALLKRPVLGAAVGGAAGWAAHAIWTAPLKQ